MISQVCSSKYSIYTEKRVYSNYQVIVSSSNHSVYRIYLTRTSARISPYNIVEAQHYNSVYKIHVNRSILGSYPIEISRKSYVDYEFLVARDHGVCYPVEISSAIDSSYHLSIHKRVSSEYKILEIFHPKVIHTAKYRITDYTWISIPNQSRYGINWSGLTSIVERIACIATPYANYTSDRYIAPELYTRYDTNRNLLTDSYRIVSDERQTFVERQKLQSERYTTYERFYTEQDKVNCLWNGYFVESDTRNNTFTSYAQAYTNRYTICTERETLQTDRHCFTLCIWNSYRYIHTKYWWPSERYAVSGYCIPFRTFADQRICHPQIHTTKLAVIRSAYTESCSFTYQLTINPKYQSFSCGETESSYRELFSSTVTPIISNFYNIPVNWFYSEHDLIIIKDDGNWWANIGEDPAPFVPLERLTAHTLAFKGYLIHRHKPLYVRLTFMFEKQPGFESPDAYYKYLVRHGYLKVTVNTKEVEDRDAVIACDKPMFPIPFEVQMYEKLVRKVTLKIVYGYPYFDIRKNKSLLYFTHKSA